LPRRGWMSGAGPVCLASRASPEAGSSGIHGAPLGPLIRVMALRHTV
jgi:hypothetical protein